MTIQQRSIILSMRESGRTYGEIARMLGLSVNSVKSFARRHAVKDASASVPDDQRLCRQCEKVYPQPPKRKPKLFCSGACRLTWWNKHKALLRSAKPALCPGCGKEFMARPDQRYCCHPCYVHARFGGDGHAQHAV